MKPSLLGIIASIVFHSVSADYGEFPFLFLSPLSSRNLKKKDRKEKKRSSLKFLLPSHIVPAFIAVSSYPGGRRFRSALEGP